MLYKVLGINGQSCYGGSGVWSLPHEGKPGGWMPKITGKLVLCRNAYHLCREQDLVYWLGPTLYVAEAKGWLVKDENKIGARRARLLRRLDTWNERSSRLFAADCAEHVLLYRERQYPTAVPSRKAIAEARDYAQGRTSPTAWGGVGVAVWDAARANPGAAERTWQTQRLMAYLRGEVS